VREVTPDPVDPGQIAPDGAEPICAVTYLLQLPFCLRVGEVSFLVSDVGEVWEGWNPHAVAHMTEFPPLRAGLKPYYRISLGQAAIFLPPELLLAEQVFPDWEGFAEDSPPRPSEQEPEYLQRSAAQVSVYSRANETPLAEENDEVSDATVEWLSRRFDDALSILNQYLVILAALHDEWHISSISRSDLPRTVPWRLEIFPKPGAARPICGTLDAHPTLRGDLPDQRPAEEIKQAVELIHRFRAGEVPFFDWLEHYQAAEHHLGSGRNAQSVISATTAIEVLINTLFRVLWAQLELDPKRLPGVLDAGFKNQLADLLPRHLDRSLELRDKGLPPGRWYADCYRLRNRIVHEGHKASAGETMDAKLATRDFAIWIGESLSEDPRIDWIKQLFEGHRHPRR
jgi:hypothetical protein